MNFKLPFNFRQVIAHLKKKGGQFWEKLKEIFFKEAITVLVTALLLLIGLVLGFPKLNQWYEKKVLEAKYPPRNVYYEGYVHEANTLLPIEGVEVKIEGMVEVMAETNQEGKYFFSCKEPYGHRLHVFVLVKEGYEVERYPEIPAPTVENDTTTSYFQMKRLEPGLSIHFKRQ